MDQIQLSEALGLWLNGQNPVLSARDFGEEEARAAFEDRLDREGFLSHMTDSFREGLLSRFRVLSGEAFGQDPYLRQVRPALPAEKGRFLLTEVPYRQGELIQYRMPDYDGPEPMLHIACLSSPFRTLALYENGLPWMTVCPSEISSMEAPMRRAHGRVLTLGLGLGYYPFIVSQIESVSSVTVVEREKDVIALFRESLLPFFPHPEKIHLVEDDALQYCARRKDGEFDYCFADLWMGQEDGAPLMLRLRELLNPLKQMQTDCWIEKEIRAWLIHTYAPD